MYRSFKNSTNCRLLCVLFFALTFGFLQAQDKKTIPDVEKIYLHTDKSIYFVGEDLWYKAYTVRASNNLLFDNSNILYVELISPDAKIIARNKTNLELGLGHGDFQLVDSLGVKPGVYQLRAYTNWNRNFGEDFVFKKNIEIIDVFEPSSNPNTIQNPEKETKPKTVETTNQNNFTVDFFPEGGSLLENVTSIVGFKAVDSNGNPIDIKGGIYDSDADDELVTSFLSAHDGMGKFQMIPMEGKNYYAKIKTPDGKLLHQDLPKAAKKGYLLSYRIFKGKNIISICTNSATLAQNPDGVLTLVSKARGISYLETKQTVRVTELSFELPKEIAPDGISQITLLDSDNKPQSERLVYFEKEHDLEVQLTTDKTSYQPNEKATINLSSISKAGVVQSASFSLSVTDMNGVTDEKDFGTTISSYFLMESDIRGKVNNPGYYFDAANSKRLEHLDDLLLTQGWRDFVWKTIQKVDDKLSYKVEKSIVISGRVKQLLGRKPLVNNNMSLNLSNGKERTFFNATTDSIGRFKFEKLLFSGKTKMALNSRNEKGKFVGEIVLDPIEQPPMAISFKKESINLTETTRITIQNVFKKYTGLDVKPESVLHEVAIVGKENKANSDVTSIFQLKYFGYKRGADTDSYINIFDLLSKKIPGVVAFENSVKFVGQGEPPLFVVDNEIVLTEDISAISLSDVVSITAIEEMNGVKWNNDEAPNGFIMIMTTSFTDNQSKTLSSINKKMEGFYTARVFYSPTPEQAELDNIASARNTLYWNPELRPDKTGNASATYYNTKVETKIKVALEGITAAGIPVVKKAYYTIRK